jgi:hypothetical protein
MDSSFIHPDGFYGYIINSNNFIIIIIKIKMEEFSQLSSSMQAHEIEPSSYSTSTIIGRPIRKAATTTMAKYEPFDESNKIPRKRAKSTTLGLPKIKQNNDNITIKVLKKKLLGKF